MLPVRGWGGLPNDVGERHGSGRNRTVVVAASSSCGLVAPDDPIAISSRLSGPAAAAGMPGAGTVDDRNRAAHALATRRSTALPWRRWRWRWSRRLLLRAVLPLPLLLLLLSFPLLLPLLLPVLVLLRTRFAVLGSSITRRAERRGIHLRERASRVRSRALRDGSRWLSDDAGFTLLRLLSGRHGGDFTTARRTSLDSARLAQRGRIRGQATAGHLDSLGARTGAGPPFAPPYTHLRESHARGPPPPVPRAENSRACSRSGPRCAHAPCQQRERSRTPARSFSLSFLTLSFPLFVTAATTPDSCRSELVSHSSLDVTRAPHRRMCSCRGGTRARTRRVTLAMFSFFHPEPSARGSRDARTNGTPVDSSSPPIKRSRTTGPAAHLPLALDGTWAK